MIGSSTYIVKQKGKFCAHIGPNFFNGLLAPIIKRKKTTPYQFFANSIANKWGKPDIDNLTQEEVNDILLSTTCNKDSKGYNKYAGDGMYLIVEAAPVP